jgi:hypothetical protein
MVLVAYAGPVTPAAVLRANATRSVLYLLTDIHSCYTNRKENLGKSHFSFRLVK